MANQSARLLGSWGESRAAGAYRAGGYRIVAMNYQSRFGEIDVIAENRRFIVFAEVKLRKSARFARAGEYVDGGKQQRLILTAGQWLAENETEKQPRFDVVEIYAPDGIATVKPEICITENAFHE